MRYAVLLLAVVVGSALPAAALSAELPYMLTFSGTATKGSISGAWGGLFARGSYSGGRWAIFSGGRVVVDGTYHCDTGCTFEGSVDYATLTPVRLYVETLGDTPGTQMVRGSLAVDLTPPTLMP